MNPGTESNYSNVLLRTPAINTMKNFVALMYWDYQTHLLSKPDDAVLEKFQSQLTQDDHGCYETSLIWKEGQSKLKNNKTGSLGRLKNLVRHLQQEPKKFKAYDDITEA